MAGCGLFRCALRGFAQSHPQTRNWRLRDDRSVYQRIYLAAMERRQQSLVGIGGSAACRITGGRALKQRHDASGRDEEQGEGQVDDDGEFMLGRASQSSTRRDFEILPCLDGTGRRCRLGLGVRISSAPIGADVGTGCDLHAWLEGGKFCGVGRARTQCKTSRLIRLMLLATLASSQQNFFFFLFTFARSSRRSTEPGLAWQWARLAWQPGPTSS
jgi:hypothetical protein